MGKQSQDINVLSSNQLQSAVFSLSSTGQSPYVLESLIEMR
jgi:hypothetical protein